MKKYFSDGFLAGIAALCAAGVAGILVWLKFKPKPAPAPVQVEVGNKPREFLRVAQLSAQAQIAPLQVEVKPPAPGEDQTRRVVAGFGAALSQPASPPPSPAAGPKPDTPPQ